MRLAKRGLGQHTAAGISDAVQVDVQPMSGGHTPPKVQRRSLADAKKRGIERQADTLSGSSGKLMRRVKTAAVGVLLGAALFAVPPSHGAPLQGPSQEEANTLRERESLALALSRAITITATGNVPASGNADLRIGLDLGTVRDVLAPYLHRDERNVGSFMLDFATTQAWDWLGGAIEHAVYKALGKDVRYKGLNRFLADSKQHGLFRLRADGMEWKDGNFGTWVNTLHGVPHNLGSGFMLARGYDPLVAAAVGLFNDIVMHELCYERWEQPKSIYDMFCMNFLGFVFGSFPGTGMEIGYSPLTGQPLSKFYVKDDDRRYFVAFEQHFDYAKAGVPQHDRAVLPWHIIFGASVAAQQNLELGLNLKLHTNPLERSDPIRAIQHLSIGAELRWTLP